MPTHEITLDMNKSVQIVRPEVIVRVGDAESQVIQATLYDDGIPYTPTGELRVQIERRDGGLIITRTMTRVSSNVYKSVLPGVACAWHGESRTAYVAEYREGKVYATSSDFRLKILPGSTTEEAIKYFDEELEEIRRYAGEAGSMIADNEQKRQDAETARATAEQQRASAEQARVSAETKRDQAETKRSSAEQARETAEAARKSAEQTRQTQEQTRQTNEAARKSAEQERETAEQARSKAEQARETAEQARSSAEQGRESYVSQLREDVDAGRYDGATFTPTVDDLGNISWENDKERPNPPTKNIKGPKGDTGEGLNVLGKYDSFEALQAAHESGEHVGEAYMVGTHYYFWDGSAWQDGGELKGAKGDPGENGENGGYYTPSIADGVLTWTASKEDMPPASSATIGGGSDVELATDADVSKAIAGLGWGVKYEN